jgi:hypothetical protein
MLRKLEGIGPKMAQKVIHDFFLTLIKFSLGSSNTWKVSNRFFFFFLFTFLTEIDALSPPPKNALDKKHQILEIANTNTHRRLQLATDQDVCRTLFKGIYGQDSFFFSITAL